MRLGFDLDGTLANLQGALAREARSLFPAVDPASLPSSADPKVPPASPGTAGTGAPPFSSQALRADEQRELWAAVCARVNFWETLEEIEPGVLTRLFTIARARKWEVIFLTSRPQSAGEIAQIQTQRWLESKGFSLPSVFVVQGSRGRIASALALDVVVDDRLDNCLDVIGDSKARAVLVWREGAGRLPASAKRMGVGVVRSVAECLDILTDVEGIAKDRGNIVSRVMRALGRKQTASAQMF